MNAITSVSGDYQEIFWGAVSVEPSISISINQHPRIVKTMGVCGGTARVADTRIPVWCLVSSRNAGCTDKMFLENYPFLSQEDLDAAWEYATEHETELREQIVENQDA